MNIIQALRDTFRNFLPTPLPQAGLLAGPGPGNPPDLSIPTPRKNNTRTVEVTYKQAARILGIKLKTLQVYRATGAIYLHPSPSAKPRAMMFYREDVQEVARRRIDAKAARRASK